MFRRDRLLQIDIRGHTHVGDVLFTVSSISHTCSSCTFDCALMIRHRKQLQIDLTGHTHAVDGLFTSSGVSHTCMLTISTAPDCFQYNNQLQCVFEGHVHIFDGLFIVTHLQVPTHLTTHQCFNRTNNSVVFSADIFTIGTVVRHW